MNSFPRLSKNEFHRVSTAGRTSPHASSSSAGPANAAATTHRGTRLGRSTRNRIAPMTTTNSATARNIRANFSPTELALVNQSMYASEPDGPARRDGGCCPRRPPGGPSADQSIDARPRQEPAGQESSTDFAASSVEVPVSQLTIAVQKVPAPTSPGIRSDASNRITEFGSARISADSLSNSVARLSGSRRLLALTQPPIGVVLALVLAQSALDR